MSEVNQTCQMYNKAPYPVYQGVIDKPIEQRHFRGTEIHSRQDPITRQLPPEVVSEIFGFTLPNTALGRTSLEKANTNSAVLKLGGVCRAWRTVAWSAPQLWTHISIFIDLQDSTRNGTSLELAQDWLSRAGHLPLSFQILVATQTTSGDRGSQPQSFKPLVSLINRHSARWKDLDIACPDWFLTFLNGGIHGSPTLQKLCIFADYDPFHSAEYARFQIAGGKPAPVEISVDGCRFSYLDVHWHNVTRVNINGIGLEGCFQVLMQAPKLVDVNFSQIHVLNATDMVERLMEPANQPIILHNLRCLLLDLQSSMTHQVMNLFLACFTLPALAQLEVGLISFAKHLTALVTLIKRSSCHLTSLSLIQKFCIDDAHDRLASLLCETPELRHLQVVVKYGRGPPHFQTRLLQLLAETRDSSHRSRETLRDPRPFLPNLESFHCGIGKLRGSSFPWMDIANLFGPPRDIHTSHCRQLKQLRVSWICEVSPPYFEEEAVLRLLELVDLGVKLDTRDTKEDLDLLQLSIEHHGLDRPRTSL